MTEVAQATAPAEPTATAPSAPVPAAVEPKKYKVKAYDKELEVTEDELIKNYQIRAASDEKFRKASEMEKNYQDFIKEMAADPWNLFKKLGKDADSEAEQRLIKKLQYENMSPSEKRAHELEMQVQELKFKQEQDEANTKAEKEKIAKEQQDQLDYQAAQEVDLEISEALKATGIKPTPKIIQQMAEVMLAHLSAKDGQRLEANKAFETTRDESFANFAELVSQMSPEDIVTRLPKGALDIIRKALLNQVTSQSPVRKTPSVNQRPATIARAAKGSTDSFFDKLERKFK